VKRNFDDIFFDTFLTGLPIRRRRVLAWSDLVVTGTDTLKSIYQLSVALGVRMDPVAYGKLIFAYRTIRSKIEDKKRSSKPIHDFMSQKFKGSKTYRKIISGAFRKIGGKTKPSPIIKFAEIAGVVNASEACYPTLNSMWTTHFFPSDFKTFLFKKHHNILGLNSRVHHINPDRQPTCTFCIKTLNFPAERETFEHFFWYCPSTNKIITKFFEFFIEGTMSKKFFFTGCTDEGGTTVFSRPAAIVFNVLSFVLWNFKLRKKLPTWPGVIAEFFLYF
jgi:hypothetical protein